MSDYYKEELMGLLVKEWTPTQIENYIGELEVRVKNTKDQIRTLKALKRRMTRNNNLKDNGPRGGS